MSYLEEMNKLRQRVRDAVERGVVEEDSGGVLSKIMTDVINDAEQHRRKVQSKADEFRRQACVFDGQAQAFNSVSGMLFQVLNGIVIAKEREDKELEKENLESDKDEPGSLSEEAEVAKNKAVFERAQQDKLRSAASKFKS